MMEDWHINLMKNRPRICIFCGERPHEKNNEHIIPQWLIELTGDPNRKIILGPFVSQSLLNPDADLFRSFSFGSFQFPSCTRCNSTFASLEGQARPRIAKLVEAKPLSSSDFEVILEWFDKVRIGLWLGYHYFLDHNFWGISPKFHIRDRIGAADRVLSIIRTVNNEPGIRFSGVNTPAFAHVPSCFTLTINEWFIVNVSYHFIVSKAAGLPHPHSIELNGDEQLMVELDEGTGNLSTPILPLKYDRSGTTIGQSILPEAMFSQDREEDDEGVRGTLVDDFQPTTSPVLIESRGKISKYPDSPSTHWLPESVNDFYDMQYKNAFETLSIQNQLIERIPVSDTVAAEQKEYLETNCANCIDANSKMLAWLSETDQDET